MSSLADRLAEASHDLVVPVAPATDLADGPPAAGAGGADGVGGAGLAGVTEQVRQAVLDRVGGQLADPTITDARASDLVEDAVHRELTAEDLLLTTSERHRIIREVHDDLVGHGPLEPFLRDADLTEIVVNGCRGIYADQGGRLVRLDGRFTDEGQLRRVIERIVARGGRRVDESNPMVKLRLPDGTQVTVTLPPLAVDGPLLTLRKLAPSPYTAADLVAFGTVSQQAADLLAACVRARLTVVVSGGTGSGRTTTLSALASFVPADERIVTVEDVPELQVHQPHLVRLQTRPPDAAGSGEVGLRELLRHALRLRPDRLVVGDLRDDAALVLLQALATGRAGSLFAVTSGGPRDSLERLAAMALLHDGDPSWGTRREPVAAVVDLVVHQSRLPDGSRRVTHVTEVRRRPTDGEVTLHDLFVLDGTARDESGRVRGRLRATGVRPAFLDRLTAAGESVDPALLVPDGP